MAEGLITATYISAAILFILALGGLSGHESAKRAIWYGIIGMFLAMTATIYSLVPETGGLPSIDNAGLLVAMILAGAVLGLIVASRVQMTGMPQLVAALHSFVGLAAVFIGLNADLVLGQVTGMAEIAELTGFAANLAKKGPVEIGILKVEILLGIFIGAVTFTGSVIAFGKLAGSISGLPRQLPGGHILNLAMGIACVVLGMMYLMGADTWTILAVAVIAGLIGCHLIMGIGGADMPVVVSMLNSYSGWAAAAIGFTLENYLLIVTGALVGSSGAILSYIMCRAMNRQFVSVILGGFGGTGTPTQDSLGEQQSIDAEGVANVLEDTDSVIIVPGYGMAVAQAQNAISSLTDMLRSQGKEVRFAIHPVAGRLPGHMNVLLAEARVPYDIVFEMDEINADFPAVDVVIVVGSNDIVNPSALDDPNSPIAGMPVLEVWKSKIVIVSKRGQGTGYSGIENPLFYRENTRMFFGDAKASIDRLLAILN